MKIGFVLRGGFSRFLSVTLDSSSVYVTWKIGFVLAHFARALRKGCRSCTHCRRWRYVPGTSSPYQPSFWAQPAKPTQPAKSRPVCEAVWASLPRGGLARRCRAARKSLIGESGSREVLLPPRPLRTGRESCPSSGSSIHERPARDAAVERPSRYAPGADELSARLVSSEWSASQASDREPHQRALLPPTSLLVSLDRLTEVLS